MTLKVAPTDILAELARREMVKRRGWYSTEDFALDPVAFAERVLGLSVWSRMGDILRSVVDHDRVAVRAGRKTSKSTSIATLALWWALARGGQVLITTTTYSQAKGILWRELGNQVARAGLHLTVPLDPGTGIRTANGGSIAVRTTAKRENMQGYSGADVLYLADESSGLPREILEAIDGNLAGGGKFMMFGNPTRLAGYYYDAFHSASRIWHPLRISSRESPNVTGEVKLRGLATPEWIRQMEDTHGVSSDFVSIHVNGEFAADSANSVISLALVDDAQMRSAEPTGPLYVGVDVARTGSDKSVVYMRRGNHLYPPVAGRGLDGPGVATLVMTALDSLGTPHATDDLPIVNVDVIGVGASAYDSLKTNPRLVVNAVNVAESATNPNYRRLRDQLWFSVATWLKEGGALALHDDTREELLAPVFTFDERGRYVVSSKDDIRATLGRSSDFADALALSIYQPPRETLRIRRL